VKGDGCAVTGMPNDILFVGARVTGKKKTGILRIEKIYTDIFFNKFVLTFLNCVICVLSLKKTIRKKENIKPKTKTNRFIPRHPSLVTRHWSNHAA
jgi:hypothetical protein